jgi:hypothetical protein
MRMRIVMSLTFLALAATASAQDIRITPKLRAGDAFRLEITRTRENSPASPQGGKSSTTIDVRVLTVTPEGSTLEWESGATAANIPAAQEPLMLAASDAMSGMKPVIRLTPDGEVDGLVNEAEVLAKVQAAVDIIRRGLLEKMPPAANRQGFEAMLAQVLSPATLIGTVMRDARTYFGLNGVELAVGETPTADIEQPNPIGGEALPAKFSVHIESATADTAVLVTTTTYDGGALMRVTRQLLEKAGAPVSPEELAKYPAMQMGDEGRFVFDRAAGLMREVIVNRRLSVAGQGRLDRTEIRLVAPPKR